MPDQGAPRLHIDNPAPFSANRHVRTFAAELDGDARIVRAVLHEVCHYRYFITPSAEARAETVSPPNRIYAVRLRWVFNAQGEPELERVFQHNGATVRLVAWLRPKAKLSSPGR